MNIRGPLWERNSKRRRAKGEVKRSEYDWSMSCAHKGKEGGIRQRKRGVNLTKVRQARIRESSVLVEHMWLHTVFHIEHSSFLEPSFRLQMCVLVIHTLDQGQVTPPSPGPGATHALRTPWLLVGNQQVLPSYGLAEVLKAPGKEKDCFQPQPGPTIPFCNSLPNF
jgi:hypothetical protein